MSKNLFTTTRFVNVAKLFVIVCFVLVSNFINAQSMSNYAGANFTATSGTYTTLSGGTTVPSLLADDVASSFLPIGFSFVYMGVPYTQVRAGSDGYLSFGATGNSISNNLSTGTTVARPVIAPFWDDMDGRGTGAQASYLTTGSAPNRIFTFEWLNWVRTGGTTPVMSFQVKLYEVDGKIEFVYRSDAGALSGAGASIGLGAIATGSGNFVSLNGAGGSPTTSTTSETTSISAKPATGQTYTFLPPTTIAGSAPSGINFTGVGATGMTVNWTDNTSNETGFALFSSTDNVTFTYVANVAAGVTTYAATGLNPSTTYYWQVYATTEGTSTSAGIGSQATTAAPTYYWVGGASGNWNTAANWNTNPMGGGSTRTTPSTVDILVIDDGGTVTLSYDVGAAQTIGQFSITNNTNVVLSANSGGPRVITISGGTGTDFSIATGSTLNMTNATLANTMSFVFSGTGNTGTIDGTLTIGGHASNSFVTTGGTSTVVTVNGSINFGTGSAGTLTGSAATLQFAAGSNYRHQHATASGTIPTATWNATSTVTVEGYTAASMTPSGLGQTFGNFTWNCTGQGTNNYNLSLTSTTFNVASTFTVSSTGTSGTLRLAGTGSYTCNVGTLTVSGGNLGLANGASGTPTLNATNVNVSGGTLDISAGSSTNNPTLNISGTLNHTSGVITESGSATSPGVITFNGSSEQNATIIPASITNTINWRINNSAGVNLGNQSLPVNSGAFMNFTAGVFTSSASPTITYAGSNGLRFTNTTAKTVTADEWPATNITNITMSGTGGVTLNSSRTLASTSTPITLTSGVLTLGASVVLTLNQSGATPPTASSTSYINIETSGAAYEITSTGTVSRNIAVGVGTSSTGNRNISITSLNSTNSLIRTSILSGGGGTAGTGMSDLSATRRYLLEVISGTLTNYATIQFRYEDDDNLSGNPVADRRIAQSATLAGSYNSLGPATGTVSPITSTSGAYTSLGYFALGVSTGTLAFSWDGGAMTNNWGDADNWSTNTVPTVANSVNLSGAITVVLDGTDAGPYNCNSLIIGSGASLTNSATKTLTVAGTATINSTGTLNANTGTITVTGASATGVTVNTGGTLNIAGGTINIGPGGVDGCNRVLQAGGTFSLTSGNVNVNGHLAVSGTAFTQSGGTITINPNDGASAAGSATTHAFAFTASTLNCSAGTINIVNPPFNTLSTVRSVSLSSGTAQNSAFTGTHTFEFGGGGNTITGPASTGFVIDGFPSTARFAVNHVIVNSGDAALNRFVRNTLSSANGTYIKGNLTINSGSQFRWVQSATDDNCIGGNVVNNGNMISAVNLIFGDCPAATLYTPSATQAVGGIGTFENAISSPTGAFTQLITNNSAGVVTINKDVTVTGDLTLTAGRLAIGASNTLTLAGTVSRTSGFLRGSATSNLICTNATALGSLFFDHTTPGTTNALNNFTKNSGAGSVTLGNNTSVGATEGQVYLNGILTVSAGSLDVSQTVTGNHIVLVSNGTNQARVANTTGGTITQGANTKIIVERFTSGNQRSWRFLTAPLTGDGLSLSRTVQNQWQNTGGVLGSDGAGGFGTNIYGPSGTGLNDTRPAYSMRGWDYSTKAYYNVTNTTTEELFGASATAANKPYMIFSRGDKSITTTSGVSSTRLRAVGRLQTGNQAFNYASATTAQFVAAANPYACQVDWELVRADGLTNINSAIYYIWDPRVSSFGGWVGVNNDGAGNYTTSINSTVSFTAPNSRYIQSGQAFFVRVVADGASTLTFSETHKLTTNANATVTGAGNGLIDKFGIDLLMVNTDNSISVRDGLFVKFGNGFSTSINEATGEDATKVEQSNETISVLRGTTKLGFEGRGYIQANDTIKLQMERMIAGTNYKFAFFPTNFDNTVTEAKLVDKFLNTETPISLTANTDVPFTITSTTGSNTADRFMIVFRGTGNLPNNKLSLVATKKDKDVQLNWNIASEIGVKEYELQRSVEGTNFQAINTQNASGKAEYTNLDTKANNGINYYRVKMTMLNDDVRYSNVVTINLKPQTSNPITVYPNPVKGQTIGLQLTGIDKGEYDLRLIDVAGKVVYTQNLKVEGSMSMQVTTSKALAKGNYTLQLVNNKGNNYSHQILVVE